MSNATEQIFLLSPPVGQPTSGLEKAPGPAASQQINLHDVKDFSSVCRTCATVTQYVIPIFEGDGLLNKLAEKIHKHLPIQVSEKDVLPRVMCYQCASTLLAWHELVQCCVQADAALRTRLAVAPAIHPSPTSRPGTNSQVVASPPVEVGTAGPGASFSSKVIAATTFAAADAASAEERLGRGTQTEPEMCAENAANQDDKREQHPAFKPEAPAQGENFKIEIKIEPGCDVPKHREDIERPRDVTVGSDGKRYATCPHCGRSVSVSAWRRHWRTHRGERHYSCHTCGLAFSDSGNLARHARAVHAHHRPHRCPTCLKTFSRRTHLEDHLKSHSPSREFVCDVCGKASKSGAALRMHSKTHDACRFRCMECGSQFKRRGELRAHVSVHTGEKAYVCACGRAFRLRSQLTAHARTHSTEPVKES